MLKMGIIFGAKFNYLYDTNKYIEMNTYNIKINFILYQKNELLNR